MGDMETLLIVPQVRRLAKAFMHRLAELLIYGET